MEAEWGGTTTNPSSWLARTASWRASRAYEPGSYFELWVSPWGHVRCTCPGFTYRGICKHVEALRGKLKAPLRHTR